jgi:alkanesulfonate monooxygenase SsuD/methylene tetrahydromethanopterin reductase-like flavin-dependent oxidoreductase (luciferase family)
VLERDADATSVELSRESAEEMLAEIKRLTAEAGRMRDGVVVAGRLFAALRDTLAEANADNERLRAVLQRVRRFGSPMIRGYIDGALGRQAGGSDPLADDQVGSVGKQGAQG